MNQSESITNLAGALASFHNEIGVIKHDAENPHFKSTYASLPNILEEIKEPMKKAGLLITQFPDGQSLVSILIHPESGEFMSAAYDLHPDRGNLNPQTMGSAITYARRYAISAILGLSIEDDDDGNKASAKPENGDTGAGSKQYPPDDRPWLTEKQFNEALTRINEGETELYETIDKQFRMKKTYRAALKSAAKID